MNTMASFPASQEDAELIKNFCLDILGINPNECKIQVCNKKTNHAKADYCPDTQTIQVFLGNINSVPELFCTICHECRHCYQKKIEQKYLKNKAVYNYTDIDGVSFKYLDWLFEPDDNVPYPKQHKEVDAEVFAQLLTRSRFVGFNKQELVHDDDVYKLVNYSQDYLLEWFNSADVQNRISLANKKYNN